jgi:hypothetical protein
VWEQLVDGTIVGIDGRMRTVRAHVDQTSLPLVG